jgi:hypothetical protein
MPVYKLNGQTYDIPENVVANFEKDNPNATVAYQANGNTYDIPVSERKGFLSQFPDAVLEGQQKKQPQQAPAQTVAQQPQIAPQPEQAQANQPYKPTWQEQWAFDITANQGENAAFNAALPINQREADALTYQEKSLGQAPELGRKGRVVEDNGGYITSNAERYNVMVDANKRQQDMDALYFADIDRRIRDAFERRDDLKKEMDKIPHDWVDLEGRLHKVSEADRQKYSQLAKEYNDTEQELRKLTNNERFIGSIEEQGKKSLNDIYRQYEELKARREKAEGDKSFLDKFFDFVDNVTHPLSVIGIVPSSQQIKESIGAYGKELQDIAKEENVLGHRRDLVQESMDLLNEYRYEQQGGIGNLGLVTAARNVWNTAAKKDTWDFGINEFDRSYTIMQAIMKQDNGQPLSENEKALLNDWAYNNAVSGQYNEQLSGWAKAGMVTGESLPFMLEMALNPLSGLGEAATKTLTKYAVKRYGSKWVRDHIKSVVASKIATRAVADIAGAYGMASTTGIARTAADAVRRMTGEVNIGVDANGDITFNGIKPNTKEEPLMAFVKAFTNTGIENWSEMAGNYFGFLSDYFGKVIGKAVIGKAGRKMLKATGSVEGVSLNKAQKFIYELVAGKGIGAFSQGLADFAKKTQWHGVGNEYLEEVIGNIANAATVGDMTFDTKEDTGVFNLQQNIDTFCGVALMGGFMSALHTGGFVGHKINYNPDKVSEANAKLFGDELWGDIKSMIDNSYTDPRELKNSLTYILGSSKQRDKYGNKTNASVYSPEGKKAILKYTQAVLEKEGAEMVDYQPRMEFSSLKEVTGEDGKKQWQVTSTDKYGNTISQQSFDTEEEAKAYEGELKMQQQHQDYKDYLSMSTKLSFSEANDIIDEFLGLNSGTWTSEEAKAEAIAQMNDPNTTLGKQFQEFKLNKVVEKAKATQAAIAEFEAQNGWTPGTVKWLAEQDPMQLDEEGLQMQDQARDFLEQLAYPSNEVHVEHEQQKGANAGQEVVEKVVSTEEPIDPQNNVGKVIQDQWNAAQAARQAAFDKDEDLKQEVESREKAELTPQEIIASLTTFRPEQRQSMVDYYNAKARYESMLNEAAKAIDKEAQKSRERHTFKGKINGQPDTENVLTITNGTNTYTLVSGDITTNSQGQITNSASGLIIGFDDATGEFVQLSDTDGYTIGRNAYNLDQFEEMERERLGQNVTTVIDPNGTLNQQAPQQQVQSENVGGEAGGANATGANEPSAPAPAADTTQQLQQQPAQIPVDEKTGAKLYHEGQQSIDETINDMQEDGWDVNMMSQANINKAQKQLDKVNKKIQNGDFEPEDLMEQKRLQAIVDYYNKVKARYLELNPPYVDPQPFIQQMSQATSKKKADEILNAALQAGVKAEEIQPAHTQKVSGLIAKEEEERRKAEEITEKDLQDIAAKKGTADGRRWLLDRRRVPSYAKRIKMAKLIYGDLFDDEFSAWRDLRELISSWLGKGRMFDPDSFGQALGWDMGIGKDAAKVQSMFTARRENGGDGMTWDAFVHQVWESSGDRFDTEDISRELEEMFRSALDKYDLTEYQLQNRVAEAENALVNQENYEPEEGETLEQNADIPTGGLPFAPPVTQRPLGMSEEDAVATIEAMKEHATVAPVIEINDENWQNNVSTPVGSVKMGEHQKEKMFVKGREQQYGMLLETITNPDIVLEEMDSEDSVFHERPSSYIFVKTFVKPDGTKYVHFESVTVSQDGMEVSISSHIIKESKLKDKLMNDKMLYKNESLSPNSSEWRLAEQQEAVPDLLPTQGDNVSEGKDTENSDTSQENQPKSLSREEYLTLHPLTEEQIMADTEATEDEKLNAIDFLKGEDNSAISQFYYNSIYNRAQQPKEEQKSTGPQWQYEFHYDKDSGRAWITRDDVSGRIPIGDGRFRIEGKNLAELRGILENPANNLGPIMEQVEAQLHNAEVGEQLRKETSDPMEAINQAATEFKAEQERKAQDQADIDAALKEFDDFLNNAKGNSVLGKFMRKGLEGNDKAQTNLFDMMTGTNEAQRAFLGDLLRVSSKVGYAYIKSGIHDFQAWSKQMADAIGRKLKDVLGWDDSLINDFISEVWEQKYTVDGERMRLREHAEKLKNGKAEDQAVNVNKTENNEAENDVSLQQEAAKPAEELEGDSAEFADRQDKIAAFSKFVNEALFDAVMHGNISLKTMQGVKARAKEYGLDDMSMTDLQELVEAEIVNVARDIANTEALNDEQKFEHIKHLYEWQPTLSARDNDRINKQQYSTPAPMAFLMGKFVDPQKKAKSGLEPSAGNGMLTINLPKEIMHVNDIDEMRLSNLQKQGFGEVTSQDGTKSFGKKKYDVIVTNPPFGSVLPKEWGVYEISSLEQQMALNALDAMKDDGRAAIIIGGNTEYKRNGAVQGKDRQFLNYLYQAYNVVDVINMDGKALYTKQGTGYPVRMILINGRKPKYDPTVYAPVRDKARAEQVKTYDELFKRVNDDILRNKEHDGDTSSSVHTAESGQNGGLSDNGHVSSSNEKGVRNVRDGRSSGEHQLSTEPVVDVQRSDASAKAEGGGGNAQPETNGGMGTRPVLLHGRGNQSEQSRGSQTVSSENGTGEVAVGGSNSQRLPGDAVDSGAGLSVKQPEQKRELGAEKVPYRKQSTNPFDLQSQMPAEQADVVKKALEAIGDVDKFLVEELGYSSKEELYQALAAEQIDSVALAIHQMKKGDAFIIGDQTGIGKGRQGAALIRWAVKNGKAPVYFTAKPELFSSVYRDIKDIHSDGLRPFILASDKIKARITERKDGKDEVLFDLPSDKEQKRVLEYINKNGKLPPEYDFMITTYSQVGNGTMEYENGNKKARSYGKNKTATKADVNGQAKRDAIENLAGNSIVLMDESHLAGGESARGNYLQYVSTKAGGITYISATFAKRPDNMPLYSLRTAISKAGVAVSELIDAVKRGGATFQEIMSKALTEAGQMIRRERNMTGVTVDWKGIEDEDVIKKHYEQYDKIIGLFNDIIQFQRTYVDPIIDKMNDDAAEDQGEVNHTPGTRDMGINNTPFASQTHQIVKKVLLSLKAEEGAKFAVECLKNGEKPVICVENTNEGAADRATANSDEDMTMPDLSTSLHEGLESTLKIKKTDANNNDTYTSIPVSRLSEEGQRRYHEIEEAIANSSTGLSLSPIDVIKNYIRKAGYSIAELTGRKNEFKYN